MFPMKEIFIFKPSINFKKKLNFKMSNMNMNIYLNLIKRQKNINNGLWIEHLKFRNYNLPTFTKKIYASIEKYL